jgi:hypothetical protein
VAVGAADEPASAKRPTPGERRSVHRVVTLDDVATLVARLPESSEGTSYGNRSWTVRGRTFAWERPFSQADIRRFGTDPVPSGPILAVRVADLAEKDAVLAADPKALFTIPHFDNYAAVLIRLDAATKRAVRAALVDAWLAMAPPALAETHRELVRRR